MLLLPEFESKYEILQMFKEGGWIVVIALSNSLIIAYRLRRS